VGSCFGRGSFGVAFSWLCLECVRGVEEGLESVALFSGERPSDDVRFFFFAGNCWCSPLSPDSSGLERSLRLPMDALASCVLEDGFLAAAADFAGRAGIGDSGTLNEPILLNRKLAIVVYTDVAMMDGCFRYGFVCTEDVSCGALKSAAISLSTIVGKGRSYWSCVTSNAVNLALL